MLALGGFFLLASTAEASWLGLLKVLGAQAEATETVPPAGNSQTLGLQALALLTSSSSDSGGNGTMITGGALLPDSGPAGTVADIVEQPATDQISLYTVRPGDTLSEIAEMYGVSINTIAWANDISIRSALKEGQTLVILPVSGVRHTVIKGDTIQSIAKKYKGDAEEITKFNDLPKDAKLAIGQIIIIPNGEEAAAPASSSGGKASVRAGGPEYAGYYLRPVSSGIKTQSLHGYNAVDIGVSIGTHVMASAAGRVIVSKDNGGYNGGYGNYLVIEHPNKTQTLYAHLSQTLVTVGQTVAQGQLIGLTGNSGKSTGPHLHFEIRGAKNPF